MTCSELLAIAASIVKIEVEYLIGTMLWPKTIFIQLLKLMVRYKPQSKILVLANLDPSDRPLLDLLFQHIDDSMLVEIAHADYGDDVAIHLEALQQIRSGSIPVPLQWHPAEVLCLTRWTEWDSLNTPELISQRNHWMRLFVCTVLIWASLEPEDYEYQNENWDYTDGENSTIIQFIDSALNLGDHVSLAALKFLGWRMQCQIERALIDEDFGNCPCYAVAMLLLSSHAKLITYFSPKPMITLSRYSLRVFKLL